MSTVDVTELAATRTPIVVVSRELLWSGGVVEIKVSADAEMCAVTVRNSEEFQYLKFNRGVNGGCVNCFLHTRDMSLRGTRITATVKVWKKVLQDGREFLYIDFYPTRNEITHSIAVVGGKPDEWIIPEGSLTFETPETSTSMRFGRLVRSVGTVILAPADTKVVPKISAALPVKPEAVEQATPKVARAGDLQLDRLLAAGWVIQDEDSTTVSLFKIQKNGKRKDLLHYRPKKKGVK